MTEKIETPDPSIIHSPETIQAHAAGGGRVFIRLDRSLAKQFLTIWWISALVSGAAVVALVATCFFIYAAINHVAVLQYDLFDLRAKTGFAHENTPEPEEQ